MPNYKYMTSISKNAYIGILGDIVRTIKMKPVDGKSNTYINSSKEINNKNSKFKIFRISKCKNIFAKVTLKIGQKKFL